MNSELVTLCNISTHSISVAFLAVYAFTLHFHECILSAFDVTYSNAFQSILVPLHYVPAALHCIHTAFPTCYITLCCILPPASILLHYSPTTLSNSYILYTFHCIHNCCIEPALCTKTHSRVTTLEWIRAHYTSVTFDPCHIHVHSGAFAHALRSADLSHSHTVA